MGSSGGGSSGAVSHSAYLETIHQDWLNNSGADSITSSVTDVMNAALGNSPWTGLNAYDPSIDITSYETIMAVYKVILSGIVETTSWDSFYTQAETTIDAITNADILADTTAFANMIDDEILTKILPRFRRGMQDINAVVSSAFPIGEAIIEAFRDREVAKHDSAIRLASLDRRGDLILNATNQMLQLMIHRIGWEEGYAKMYTEGKRIKIVAKKEQTDQDAKFDEEDALWDLEVFQFGANVMAAIQGGTSGSRAKQPSLLQSVIGGALSGSAGGATIGTAIGGAAGGPIGAGIGAVLGMASGFL